MLKINKNNHSLNCSNCQKAYDVYEAARTVPCCCQPLCHECIRLVEKTIIKHSRYTCILCGQEGDMPKFGFQLDKDIAEMLEQPLPKQSKIEESLELADLKVSMRNLLFESTNGREKIIEHFREERRLLQLATEERIQDIYDRQGELMMQLNEKEQEQLRIFSANNEIMLTAREKIDQANLMIQEYKEHLNQTKTDDNEVKSLNEKLLNFKNELEKERTRIKKEIFSDQLIRFESEELPSEKLIGNFYFENVDSSVSVINIFF